MQIGSRQSKEIGEREQSTSKQTCTDQRKCQGVQHKGWGKRNTEKALQRNAVVVSDDAVVVSDDGFLNRALALQTLLIQPCCQQACPATLLTLQHPDYSPLTALSSHGQTQADTDFDIIHFLSHTSLSFSYTSIVNHVRETFLISSPPHNLIKISL